MEKIKERAGIMIRADGEEEEEEEEEKEKEEEKEEEKKKSRKRTRAKPREGVYKKKQNSPCMTAESNQSNVALTLNISTTGRKGGLRQGDVNGQNANEERGGMCVGR